ncbi:hypothetical protein KAR28_04280 [Candidatus Parcubacteria bacterium]|nr:hypothetical protein [Candidatus Parcubacteria bacterium]
MTLQTSEQTSKIMAINKDIKDIVAFSKTVIIRKADDMTGATEFLSKVVSRKKRIEELRIKFTKPLLDQKRVIDEEFKISTVPLLEIEKNIKGKMIAYRRAEADRIKKQREKDEEKQRKAFEKEQERKRKALEAQNLNKKQQKEVDKELKRDEEAFVPQENIKQETTVKSDTGKISARKVWKFEIEDEKKITRKYLKVDEVAIRQAVRSGEREIKGVRIFEEETINSY